MLGRIGAFKTHAYTTYIVAPATDERNENLGNLIKSFYAIRNMQMFKSLRDGQPVIAFEFYGDAKKSFYLYTCPSTHKMLIKEKLQAAFPGAGIKQLDTHPFPFDDPDNVLMASMNLTKSPMYPLVMDTKQEEHSICNDMVHVMEELKEGETAFVQILLEPLDDGWQNELEIAYQKHLQGIEQDTGNWIQGGAKKFDKKLTQWAQSMAREEEFSLVSKKHREIKEFGLKIRQSGFSVCIRLAVYAKTYDRRNDIIEGLAAAIRGTASYNSWQMAPVIRKTAALESLRDRKMPLIGGNNLLCEDEAKILLKYPTKEVHAVRLERMRPDEEKVDVRVTEKIIPIGYGIEYDGKGQLVGFSIANPDTASKARLVIAPPGSGKTTLVQTFKDGAMDVGHGGSIFDVADGNLYFGCIETTDPKRRDRLVLCNWADEEYGHVFNFDSLGRDANTVGLMFAEFFEFYYKTGHNHRMNSFLEKASMTNFAMPDQSFLELILLMKDEDYRKKMLNEIRKVKPDLYLWWKTEFPKIAKSETAVNEILQPILYRLDRMQYNPNLAPIFCGRGGKLRISQWMNEGKWILHNISGGVFSIPEQRMMMSFLNYAYWAATLSRERMLQRKEEPIVHHKMYDEPQTYMAATPVTELSISKSRKYRVSDNFFIQDPTQVIKDHKELWDQIVGMNPHILVGGGLNNDQLKEMAKTMNVPVEELKRLESLEYHWYAKLYVGKEIVPPFIFNADGMVAKNYGPDKKLEREWRRKLAPMSRESHMLDIQARNLKLSVPEYKKLLDSFSEDTPDEEEGVPVGEDPKGSVGA